MKKTAFKLFVPTIILLAAMGLTTGCQTMTALHDPDKVTLQTEMEWLSPPLSMGLSDAPMNQRVVYLRVKNTSGSSMTGLYGQIAAQLQQAGYRVTNNPAEAYFSLTADVRFFGETREKDGYKGALTGGILGGVSGAVIGHNVGDNNNEAIGAAAGALVGGLIGDSLANRNKIITYTLAIDIRVGERVEGGVRTVRSSNSGGGVGNQAGVARGRSVERGHSKSGVKQEQRVELNSDFLYQDNRIAASAYKMNLTEAEAVQALTPKIGTAIGSVLP
jgi:hypothetical protein